MVSMKRHNWWARVTGEISKLRTALTGAWGVFTGTYGQAYRVDSSRVDYRLARALYDNTEDKYKLGAGFAKPVINTAVGFMGVPRFRSEDEDAQAVLDDFFGANVSRMLETHRNAMRDGDCWIRITREEVDEGNLYPEAPARLVYNILPPEQIQRVIHHPITGVPVEYILVSEHEWLDEQGNLRRARVTERISAKRRLVKVQGDTPPDLKPGEEVNIWGFIPIVHFKNEGDSSAKFGKSDLEAIEPFLKAYHDVMLAAIQGSKMHSTPRLKLKLKDVAAFLRNNFGITDPASFAKGGGKINLEGHELLIFTQDEDAEFIEVKSATGSAGELLKFLFYCIVDTSETPEFAFGVHTPSSHASVKEQMPVLIRRISRKREIFTEPWQMMARVVLAMTARATGKRFATHATVLEWDEIDPRDETDVAEALERIVNALVQAIQNSLISLEAAVEFLRQYIGTIQEYVSDDPEVPGERERILKTRLLLARLEDGRLLAEEEKALKAAAGQEE
ncbi:MAG: phage portal protein [Bacillota bacterium]|nr:phage portal protein [Bacillota bacterium]